MNKQEILNKIDEVIDMYVEMGKAFERVPIKPAIKEFKQIKTNVEQLEVMTNRDFIKAMGFNEKVIYDTPYGLEWPLQKELVEYLVQIKKDDLQGLNKAIDTLLKPKAKWIDFESLKIMHDGTTLDGFTVCSNCSEIYKYKHRSDKCEKCGAVMELKENENK